MKYRKPEVFELGTSLKGAKGQVNPNACVSGAAASGHGYYETCATGTTAEWSCLTGTGNTGGFPSCVPGGAASSGGDCLSGTAVQYYCESGSGGDNDPTGCAVGPSYA